jgi:hypothetical protein
LERLEDFLIMKLPYHPQWYRRGVRFDSILGSPLEFGTGDFPAASLQLAGTQPPPDSVAHVRLLSPLSSATAQTGDSVEGVLSEPMFSPDHKLILPEGTRLTGVVKQARPARFFHRNGRMRFAFEDVELPQLAGFRPPSAERVQAQLASVESDPRSAIKVDGEGTAKATESKARFLAPAIALLVASKSVDDDAGRHVHGVSDAPNANYGGRAVGGFSGFGLAGMALGRASKTVGGVLGFYGLGWSVYSTIVSRGREVEFEKNTSMDIQFGSRKTESPKLKGNQLARTSRPGQS